jgi:hypothetical protein
MGRHCFEDRRMVNRRPTNAEPLKEIGYRMMGRGWWTTTRRPGGRNGGPALARMSGFAGRDRCGHGSVLSAGPPFDRGRRRGRDLLDRWRD